MTTPERSIRFGFVEDKNKKKDAYCQNDNRNRIAVLASDSKEKKNNLS